MPRYEQIDAINGKWSDWIQPIRRGYKLCCCDCGLVHDVDFRLVSSANGGKHILFRMARNARSTALVRRAAKKTMLMASLLQHRLIQNLDEE